jgi:hypothetical protein
MKVLLALTFLVLAAAGARASDVSGKWIGTVEIKAPDGQTATEPFWAKLHQSAREVSGTAGGGDSDAAADIRNGSTDVDGTKLSFQFTDEHDVSYTAALVADGQNRFEGTIEFSLPDGTPMKAKLVLNRDEKH